jgi:hypothetical protein
MFPFTPHTTLRLDTVQAVPSFKGWRMATDELDFNQELQAVERSLQDLKTRHLQIQQAEQEQAQLRIQQQHLQRQRASASRPDPALAAELKAIQTKLDDLEFTLESRLFEWGQLKKPFWQLVRFSGLGLVLGWLMAFAVLQSPRPQPQAPTSLSPPAQAVP